MADYEKLIDLKYRKGIPTFKLIARYPEQKRQIHEVALLGIKESVLIKTIKDKHLLSRILKLKKKYQSSLKVPKKQPWLARLCPWL
ncbi:MAG: hypothetical protein BWY42_00657 [Candidatus Omnitrophica bacterium ADurb.Bin277]|nr:MAG: hypothetical protein BWY42_00657 [Candidatus Omnitrophica bacterium ADurb.Bin277]